MKQTVDTAEILLQRIRGEFLEMAGLRLTPGQTTRLWGIGPLSTATLLDTLAKEGFLARTADGMYHRD